MRFIDLKQTELRRTRLITGNVSRVPAYVVSYATEIYHTNNSKQEII